MINRILPINTIVHIIDFFIFNFNKFKLKKNISIHLTAELTTPYIFAGYFFNNFYINAILFHLDVTPIQYG